MIQLILEITAIVVFLIFSLLVSASIVAGIDVIFGAANFFMFTVFLVWAVVIQNVLPSFLQRIYRRIYRR